MPRTGPERQKQTKNVKGKQKDLLEGLDPECGYEEGQKVESITKTRPLQLFHKEEGR